MRSEILRDVDALAARYGEWLSLWRASEDRPLTLHPAWVDGWWRALGPGGDLVVVLVLDGTALRGVAPLYLRPPRGGALRVRELGLVGDGVIAPRRAVLARRADEAAVTDAVLRAVLDERSWDLLDLALLDGDAVEALAALAVDEGRRVERDTIAGRSEVRLPVVTSPPALAVRERDAADFPSLIPAIAELSSRGWERRAAEPAFVRFLERVAGSLGTEGALRVITVEDSASERPRLVAGSVLLVDGERRVELVRGVAAGWARAGEALVARALADSTREGASCLELAEETPPWPTQPAQGTRLRVWGAGTAAALGAGYSTLERRAGEVADAARGEIDRLRGAATDMVERAVARVAHFSKMHLYRGELFVRNAPPPPGVTLHLLSLADFDTQPQHAAFLRRLELDETYCRQKFERGDLVVTAELDGAPAGILWCARYPVYVPEIGREVRPLGGECYIHDVFVAPPARGHSVAPAMLEFLALELRRRDVYRAWALIERSNIASTRAFEKAAYASVADVIYARMGLASKLLVRPPDPEARKFLGLKK